MNAREQAIDRAWDAASQDSLDNRWWASEADFGIPKEIAAFEHHLRANGYMVVPAVLTGPSGLNPTNLRYFQLGFMAARDRQLNPNPNLVGEPGSGYSE